MSLIEEHQKGHMTGALSVFALLVVVLVSQSVRFSKTFVTAPIIFLAGGGVVGRTLVDVRVEGAARLGRAQGAASAVGRLRSSPHSLYIDVSPVSIVAT